MTSTKRPVIVGSGNIGLALATLFVRAGLDVGITNTRGPESLRDVIESLGSGVTADTGDLEAGPVQALPIEEALESDLIFLAIPFAAIEQLGKSRADWTGKTVVDMTNAYYSPGAEEMLQGRPSAHYTAEQLPGAEVVKAFNTLPANTLSAELGPEAGRRVIFIATDVPSAGDRIAELAGELGLAAVQLGRIDEGGRLIQVPNALVLRNFVERPL